MPEAADAHAVEISVTEDGQPDKEFVVAANEFVTALKGVGALDVTVPHKAKDDTRGFIALLTGIIVTGNKIGAFKGIYTLAKDLFDRSRNAEVELKFKDGSVLKLKGLTQAQAEERIEKHLKSALAA